MPVNFSNLSPNPQQWPTAFIQQVVEIDLALTGQGASAPLFVPQNLGLSSISRTSAGLYVLNFAFAFAYGLLNCSPCFKPSGIVPASLVQDVVVAADNSTSTSSPSISIQVVASTSSTNPTLIAADLAANDGLLLTLRFKSG
ncbi:hypothetical protein [Anaeromyxobacter diazotrophicus]|uniref:Uncharacterized protein n=1 Tax=Anaeromyxobacter diazotrophicus TaxID=2590199 RepID=A0A7I9VKI1_9BACT|nr:hypothetical protein [Anaeromyxobacter diazotrophicus]GEJ56924.1 hypothetical protein AMYX_16650 [Anaeromyxobacter diazotrophicus]